jgi:hypothetical protein
MIKKCQVIMDGVNNLSKKQVSCRDNSLEKSFQAKNIGDVENMGNKVEDLCNEDLYGEMSYISKDNVEGFIVESRSNFMNEERNEENIVENNQEVGVKESFEQNKEDYRQGNAYGNDDVVHGRGVKRSNSNIVGRHQFEWQRVECDLVNHGGVFLEKGHVVACDP